MAGGREETGSPASTTGWKWISATSTTGPSGWTAASFSRSFSPPSSSEKGRNKRTCPSAVSSWIFWMLGFTLAVLIRSATPDLDMGPTMICFAVSAMAALPSVWKDRGSKADTLRGHLRLRTHILDRHPGFVLPGGRTRAIRPAAHRDGGGDFRFLPGERRQECLARKMVYGISLLLAANVVVIWIQVSDRAFSPIFPNSIERSPSGFFAHYNYASFLIPVSLTLAAMAVHSKERWPAEAAPRPRCSFGNDSRIFHENRVADSSESARD